MSLRGLSFCEAAGEFASRRAAEVSGCGAMPLRRCFSSLGCPGFSLDDVLGLAERTGMDAVELRSLGGTIDLAAYFSQTYGAPADLAKRMETTRVEVVALNASLKAANPTDADRAQLEGLAPWADAIGARWLRVFDGGARADDTELAAMAGTLAWWEELRRQRGWRVRLMVETHDSLFTAEAIGRLRRVVPDVAILWDAHHTWRKGGEDPVATWRAIRDRVVHVHVKDSIGAPSARHPFTYVLPGDGGFPMRELRAELEQAAFGGCVSLEWEKLWHPYLPPLEDGLRAAVERGWW